MSGIQFVTDEKGHKVGVLIDLKKHGAIWEDFWDGLVSESRRKEKGIPYEQYRAARLKRTRPRVGAKRIGCARRCAVQTHDITQPSILRET
jgi:hypothetical protein